MSTPICCDEKWWMGDASYCTVCSECDTNTGVHLETVDIKGNGGAFRPCGDCYPAKKEVSQ